MPQKLRRPRSVELANFVERLLMDGKPRLPGDIGRDLDIDYYRVAESLRLLRRATPPRVSIVGVWAQLAAMRGVNLGTIRKDCAVYSHPGAKLLPPDVVVSVRSTARRSLAAEGSGVIAPPPYRTGFRWGGIPGMGF